MNLYRVLDNSGGYDSEYTKVLRRTLVPSVQPVETPHNNGNTHNKTHNSIDSHNKPHNNAPSHKSEENGMSLESLTVTERLVLQCIANDPDASQILLAQRMGSTRDAVARHVSSLVKKGYIEHEGSRKKGRWVILQMPEDKDAR